jgi:hypothetical protein
MALFTSRNVTYNQTLIQAAVEAFKTAAGAALLATPKIHLFSNDFQPMPTTLIGDFTEAAFSGYAAVSAVLTGPVNFGLTASALVSPGVFLATDVDPFVPDTLRGWVLEDSGGSVWYAAERFPTPIPITSAGDFVDLSIALALPYIVAGFP